MEEKLYRVAVKQRLGPRPRHWTRRFKAFEIRKCPSPLFTVEDTSSAVRNYWFPNIVSERSSSHFYQNYESLTVLILSDRLVTGHIFVNFGTIKTWARHCVEFVGAAIVYGAGSIILVHKLRGGVEAIPRAEHFELKKSFEQAADPFAVRILDYVIVGFSEFRSLVDVGTASHDEVN